MKTFDIIIAGGGMAGATAALALAKLNLRIALVEPVAPNLEASPSYDQRAVALSASSVSIYQSLDLWSKIKPLACSILDIHVSDKGHFGFTRLHAADYQVEALGQVIPLDQTGPVLWQAMRDNKQIEIFCPAKIEKTSSFIEQQKQKNITVQLATEKNQTISLTAKLLLAADGTFSSIAKLLAIKTKRKNYHQHAVIANISTEKKHNNRAFERFTEQGPLALLPLTRNRMSLVWCQNKSDAALTMALDQQSFIERLQQAFGFRLGKICKAGERFEYPLALHTPEKCIAGRTLLLGNSAHTLHPIAGQGFNLGLRDIAALFDVIKQAKIDQVDIGNSLLLESFQQQRQADWQQTIHSTDWLVRLFSNNFLPLIIARNKALCLLDKLPFAKNKLARAAMGFSGESASLTRQSNHFSNL
jgi:2-octaprenyl-6-methoxyphenol hydroxylase